MLFRFSIFFLFFIATVSCLAQRRDSTVSIKGVIIDSINTSPISYSKIELHKRGDIGALQTIFTDEKGQFSFVNIPRRNYFLSIKTIGYQEKQIQFEKIDSVLTIKIQPFVHNLKEVTVEGTKPMIENKIDRLVYNPDLVTIQNSATMSDVLQKAPLLSSGQNGQLFLRGKPNVKIYLDDKPASLDVVRGMPASNISSIEIITNPSAKYDAEGYAIVNIITKKKKIDGYEGVVSGGIDFRDDASGLFNFNVKQSKLNINLTYSFNNLIRDGTSENDILRTSSVQEQLGTIQNKQQFQFGNIGADYEIDSLNKIGGSLNIFQYLFNKTFSSNFSDSNPLDSSGNYNLTSLDHIKRYGGYGEINYNHLFKNFGGTLNIAVLFNELKIDDDLKQNQLLQPGNQLLANFNSNSNVFDEITYQITYEKKFKNKSKLEVGTKLITRDNTSDYTENIDTIKNSNPSNTFQYKQNIFAIYGVYSFVIKKFNIQLGLREETTSLATLLLNGSDYGPKSTYSNLFPNANVSYKLSKDELIKISYSERIQRPSIFYLNPYTSPLNPTNITTGNPQLKPEITDKLAIDYAKTIGNFYFDGSVSYLHVNDPISSYVSTLSDAVLLTTYENADQAHSFSGDLYFSIVPFKRDNFNLSLGAEKYFISNLETENSGWNFYGTFRDSYSLKNNLNFIISLNYVSQQVSLQGKLPGSFSNNIGLTKSFYNRKLLLSFSADDPFRLGGIFKSDFSGPGFYQYTDNKIDLQTFQFRVTYYFGKKNSTKTHDNKVRNNDLKAGGQ